MAKGIYGTSRSGYGTTVRNLKSLEGEGIVEKVGTETGRNLRKKIIYALTAIHGIPAAWAFLGPRLDFNRLLQTHSGVFKNTDGLRTYIAIWEEAGPARTTQIARKSFRSFILDTEQGQSLAELIIAGIADKTIPFHVLRNIGARSKLMRDTLEEVYFQSGQLLAAINLKSQKKKSAGSLQKE